MNDNIKTWDEVENQITSLKESEKELCKIMMKFLAVLHDSGHTERELEKITGMKQSAINRLKQSNIQHPQIDTLLKLLLPLGYTIKIVKKDN